MKSLLLRNLFFTILQPGVVAGLIPYWILEGMHQDTFPLNWQSYNFISLILFVAGTIILLICIYRFASEGRGTLSPVDPTKKLVVHGLYRYSRNPMYIGVMLMLVAEAVFFQSRALWIYTAVVSVAFYLFILLHEEPRLRNEFGEDYDEYCRKVRRWI